MHYFRFLGPQPEDSAVIEMSLEPLPLDDDPDEDQESDDVIGTLSGIVRYEFYAV